MQKIRYELDDIDNVSIPGANSLDNDITDLIEDHPKRDDADIAEGNGDEILDSLEAEWTLTEDQGEEINPKLAKIINSLFDTKLPEDKIKEKLKKYPILKNCNSVSVAKCNPEVWGTLMSAEKLQDITLQKNLSLLNKAVAALASIGHHLLKGNDSITDIPINSLVVMTIDAIALLGHATQELHQFWRENLKPSLPANLKGLASNVPQTSDLLFGDDLSKRIQSIKATNTALQRNFAGSRSHQSRHYSRSVA